MKSTEIHIPTGVVQIRVSDASDGDFQVVSPAPDLSERRHAIASADWTWLKQVHGAHVVEVSNPGQHAGVEADGALTFRPSCPIAVTTADCAGVVLVAESGVAVVHAGWRGLVAGIVEKAAAQLLAAGGRPVRALVGPLIHPESYEFGGDDLEVVANRYGPSVRGATADGGTALDMPAAVTAACQAAGWPTPDVGPCTSSPSYFSHRVRGDQGRQTVVAWIESDAS